jgi:hypothetical protein
MSYSLAEWFHSPDSLPVRSRVQKSVTPTRLPEEVLPRGKKRCTICRQVLSITDFYPRERSKGGLRPHCKGCQKRTRKATAERMRTSMDSIASRYRPLSEVRRETAGVVGG